MAERACGTCSLCCKVNAVQAMFKPAGKWCQVCTPGKGCTQYQLRPNECRTFDCLWLSESWLGPEWKPEVSKFVMAYEYDGKCMTIMVDHNLPHAWKAKPYYDTLKALADRHLGEGRIVMVADSTRRWLVLPDQEVLLGGRDETFTWEIYTRQENGKNIYDVVFDRVAA
jgi:hypothetical protein